MGVPLFRDTIRVSENDPSHKFRIGNIKIDKMVIQSLIICNTYLIGPNQNKWSIDLY